MTPRTKIIGTGHSVPERILTNFDLEKMVDTTDQWIIERTGIHERHIKEPEQNNSDFCVEASRQALEEAGLGASELDMIILATVTGDMRFPSTSIFVQARLGAHNAVVFDIGAACSGFLYALSIADNMIATGKYTKILVIGSECMTHVTDWSDRNTCVLFGDGAGAAVVTKSDSEKGIIASYMGSDGRLAHLLYSSGGGTVSPASYESVDNRDHYLKMAGRDVFLHAVKAMGDSAQRALDEAGLTGNDIDLLIPHQANVRIMDATAKRIGIPREKVVINIDRYGNTSAASIPIALNEARRTGRLLPGMTCLMVVFGGGFTWASAIVKF
ncbi:3-oxoacyl-ACP synthase [candidate division LCP-89 bacterium B3_LCP]|uniref:Beta-ketoacyl-[acyl-carrier-protein] synthase III n=1 Tax=candidate division LCP-89 bacterium B3_LCP TaxID=2012998 RepID=A0A532V5L2_UNCL8|nr:MAG: 3-oxoacyl-ACP synthase [candidate division LCP-89 bacterium B3_LCP]